MNHPFDPDWCVHPGGTLRDFMEENHLGVKSLATACGKMHPDELQDILDGEQEITETIALKLHAGTGIPVSLWLNLERMFRKGLAEGKTWTK